MKPRWKILIAVGLFLVLVATSLTVTMHVQPQSELEAYKKLLRAQGEKLEMSEVLPPHVAPEDNSVDAVEEAFRLIGSGNDKIPDAMKMVAPGKAMTSWSQSDVRGYDFTNSWEDFGGEIEANRPAIELLHQVLNRPKLDFNVDYSKGARMLIPQLVPMKLSVRVLESAAILNLHDGDCGSALTNILTVLALVYKDVGDDVLISHLVRMALTAIAVAPTWEFMQNTNVTAAQLGALQNSWEQLHFLDDAERAFVIERASSAVTIQESRNSHEEFKSIFYPRGSGGSLGGSSGGSLDWTGVLEDLTKGPRAAAAESMWRSSWSYSSELETFKNNQVVLEALRTMRTNQTEFYKADYDAMSLRLPLLGLTNVGQAFFRALRIPDFREYFDGTGLRGVVHKTLQIEVARRIVITVIALKRLQLKNGQWPQTLNELVPEFISAVPIDPYDGKPLKYHPNADGTFLLYCVGEDGKDDGGNPTDSSGKPYAWQSSKAPDWVWPQPSPADVQNFYEQQPPK